MSGFDWDETVPVYDFDRELTLSRGIEPDGPDAVLLAAIPDAVRVEPATEQEDRSGVDRWVILAGGRRVGVDIKRRKRDYDADDLALESWSVLGRKRGWTLDPAKRCEYVLWWWADSGRWCLMPFTLLRAVFAEHLDEWSARYRPFRQATPARGGRDGWRSECLFVPRLVVWRAIYDRFGGARAA